MAEQPEILHANRVLSFFFLNEFFSCFSYSLSACPHPSFWADQENLNLQLAALRGFRLYKTWY